MISAGKLKKLKTIDFESSDEKTLVDIKDVDISASLDKMVRIQKFLNDIKNPYLFKVGDTVVRVKYNKDNTSIQEAFAKFVSDKAEQIS